MRRVFIVTVFILFTSACLLTSFPLPTPTQPASPPQALTSDPSPTQIPSSPQTTLSIHRGVNFANMLDAPVEGDWGLTVEEQYFDLVKSAGFDFVRLPINWAAHTDASSPYTIDPTFFARIDRIVSWALARDLSIIIDLHQYDEMATDPTGQKERFLAIWTQLAAHYQSQPPQVLFELLNEPNTQLDADLWNQYLAEALTIARRSNPTRDVIVGPVMWNSYSMFPSLDLPPDSHLIVTFHYYDPFHFTHQGADWVGEDTTSWLGTTWDGTEAEKADISNAFDSVQAWAKQKKVRVLVGEFGAFSPAPMDSRVRWTAFVREQAEAHGFAWAYWEFASGFGVYDPDVQTWRDGLLKALIP